MQILEDNPIEILPLPVKDIPETIINATLLGYRTANQSHLFFGTDVNAKCQNNRSFWQKTTSFFGHDSVVVNKLNLPDQETRNPDLTAIVSY